MGKPSPKTYEEYKKLYIKSSGEYDTLENVRANAMDPGSLEFLNKTSCNYLSLYVKSVDKLKEDSKECQTTEPSRTYKNAIVLYLFTIDEPKDKEADDQSDEKAYALPCTLAQYDNELFGGEIQEKLNFITFSGKIGTNEILYMQRSAAYPVVALIGCGSVSKFTTVTASTVGATTAEVLKKLKKCCEIKVILPIGEDTGLPNDMPKDAVLEISRSRSRASLGFGVQCPKLKDIKKNCFSPNEFCTLVESMYFNTVEDERFKKKSDSKTEKLPTGCIEKITFYGNSTCVSAYNSKKEIATNMASGAIFSSLLVGAPANYCTPQTLAGSALKLAKEFNLDIEIFSVDEMERRNMGGILAVGKGSMYPPMFISLTYKSNTPIKKRIAFVGKGVCFDAGGYNIKSQASSIELMKFDMGGSASLLGAARTIALMKPNNVQVTFIIPTVENMVSSRSYRPGDIITFSNGKTVEIGNTDAEGRLILADALVYASKMDVDYIIDTATLTGAIIVGLGPLVTGLFSNDNELATSLESAAECCGERIWRMPIVDDYAKKIESRIATMNNVNFDGKANSIVAALFLKEFVSDKIPWAHLDIAGSCWPDRNSGPTGYCCRTLASFVLNLSV